MAFQSTKTYSHDLGLSACFRQWRATHSHCSLLHGYALSFKFVFECDALDDRNWCVDFGGLKWLKQQLIDHFDHKLVVAQDDPERAEFVRMHNAGLADVIFMEKVGCEAFAQFAFQLAERALQRDAGLAPRVRVVSCECAEHGANSAIYIHEQR